jgi:hypothetical protein
MPERIQLKRTKGWLMPENTVKVDRSTKWGNPFRVHGDGYPMDPALAVQSFRSLLRDADSAWWPTMPPRGKVHAAPPTTLDDVRRELRGKNLACWCAIGAPWHADVLLKIANAPQASERDVET